ncbi:hypothetical protein Bca4012_024893 [Brassica carinata]
MQQLQRLMFRVLGSANVLVDGEWRFRNCRDQRIREVIQEIIRYPLNVTRDDGLSWTCGEGDKFVAAETWHQLRGHKEEDYSDWV